MFIHSQYPPMDNWKVTIPKMILYGLAKINYTGFENVLSKETNI